MRFLEFATAVTAMGCGTGVIIATVDKIFGTRRQEREHELRLARERQQQQERQITELRHQNAQLQKQLEWHTKLLETEGRLTTRVTAQVRATELVVGGE